MHPVYFATDSAVVTPVGLASLRGNMRCGTTFSLTGNADERGTEAYNMRLGQRRADAVAAAFRRLGATVLHTVSNGETRPVMLGDDAGALAANRRVDVE